MPRLEDDAAFRRRGAFELLLGLSILGVILAIGGFLLLSRSDADETVSSFGDIMDRLEALQKGDGAGVLIQTSAQGPIELPKGEHLIIDASVFGLSSNDGEPTPDTEHFGEPLITVSIRRAAGDATVGDPIAVEPMAEGLAALVVHRLPLLGLVAIPEDGRYSVTLGARPGATETAAVRPTTLALLPSTREEFEASRGFMRSVVTAVFGACGVVVGPIVAIACGIPALIVRFRRGGANARQYDGS
jgi:hypothetical protein